MRERQGPLDRVRQSHSGLGFSSHCLPTTTNEPSRTSQTIMPALEVTYNLAASMDANPPAPAHPESFAAELPAPKETAPMPPPSDPLSTRAEVKSIAKPTGLYGPLLETMAVVREQVNAELTKWKEWEDAAGLSTVEKQGPSRAKKGGDNDDGDDEDAEDDED